MDLKHLREYEKLAYITEPIIEKLRSDATALIDSGELSLESALEWTHEQLSERLNMDPPDGTGDLPERERNAIYCYVMGFISASRSIGGNQHLVNGE